MKRIATAKQLVLLARRVLREATGAEADSELLARVKDKCRAWDLDWQYGHRLTAALASARFLERRTMKTWTRVEVATLCGGCGAELAAGSPVQLVTLHQVTRKLKRGPCCAGEAPPDLPASPAKGQLTKKMTPLSSAGPTTLEDERERRKWAGKLR